MGLWQYAESWLRPLGIWLLFSVVLGLFHVFASVFLWRLFGKPVKFYSLFQDGSLIFFAAPLAAGMYGECELGNVWEKHTQVRPFAVVFLVGIIIVASLLYASILSHIYERAHPPNQSEPQIAIAPKTIYYHSKWLAILAIIYGLFLTAFRI